MRGFKDEIIDCFPRNCKGIAIPLNIDFDGTVIYHGYDSTEKTFKVNGDCVNILKRWCNLYNCMINIYTTRYGNKLDEVIRFFNENEIPFYSVMSTKEWQTKWSQSTKQYGFVIDDMSACKTFYDENGRATVDWNWLVENFEPRLHHIKKIIDDIENT